MWEIAYIAGAVLGGYNSQSNRKPLTPEEQKAQYEAAKNRIEAGRAESQAYLDAQWAGIRKRSRESFLSRIRIKHSLSPSWEKVVSKRIDRIKVRVVMTLVYSSIAAGAGLVIAGIAFCWRIAVVAVVG